MSLRYTLEIPGLKTRGVVWKTRLLHFGWEHSNSGTGNASLEYTGFFGSRYEDRD